MSAYQSNSAVSAPLRSTISVLHVVDELPSPNAVSAIPDGLDGFEARRVAADEAVRRLYGIDCVVVDVEDSTAIEIYERIRERDGRLPVLIVSDELTDAIAETVRSNAWCDYYHRTGGGRSATHLDERVRRLVDHRRTSSLATHAIAAVEAAHDGIGVVGSDGTFEFTNRRFAGQFGYTPAELAGESWRIVFTDDEAERIESTVLPVVRDSWRWTGECVIRGKRGDQTLVWTDVVGLEDGGLVLLVGDETV